MSELEFDTNKPDRSSSQLEETRRSRVFAIDLIKAISITAVVSFHGIFLPLSSYFNTAAVPDQILFSPLRFCVPILFTISFFLFERELSKPNTQALASLIKRLKRLAVPTVFWFGLPVILKIAKGNNLSQLLLEILTGTIFVGAYYLLILLQFVPIYVWVRRFFSSSRNVLLVIILQALTYVILQAMIFRLLGGIGSNIITDLRGLGESVSIYWFVYLALGYYCYHHWTQITQLSERMSLRLKIAALAVTSIMMMIEQGRLALVFGGPFPPFEYSMLSCILGVCVVLVCLASVKSEDLPVWLQQLVQLLSTYSLGIFCVNGILTPVFVFIVRHWVGTTTFSFPEVLLAKLVGTVVLLATSAAISILLNRIGLGACVR